VNTVEYDFEIDVFKLPMADVFDVQLGQHILMIEAVRLKIDEAAKAENNDRSVLEHVISAGIYLMRHCEYIHKSA
jgi:hypothetical protein